MKLQGWQLHGTIAEVAGVAVVAVSPFSIPPYSSTTAALPSYHTQHTTVQDGKAGTYIGHL